MEPDVPSPQAPLRVDWPTSMSAVALLADARFIGEVAVERRGDEIAITGRRVPHGLYWIRIWLLAGGLAALFVVAMFGLDWGPAPAINVLSMLALFAVGGRVILHAKAQPEQVTIPLNGVRDVTVGLRIRAWHVLLIGFTGIAALVVFALYPGGRRTVGFIGDHGRGHTERYLLMASNPQQAIKLAALLMR